MSAIATAFEQLERGELAQAEQTCRGILAAAPGDAQAHWLLFEALSRSGRLVEAEAHSEHALSQNPTSPDLLRLRGEVLAGRGRLEEALDHLARAIDRRPIFPKAHEALSKLLAARNDGAPRFTVSVVTPTVGTAHLAQAIESVQAQDYPFVEHFIVADGPECLARVHAALPRTPRHPVHLLPLPYNTGGDGFNGHRVYAAAPYLVNGHYVAYLDEDNWLDPNHLGALMEPITKRGLEWAYSLRNVVDADGRFIAQDNCDSLGQWPTWDRPELHLVDTNCYLLRRDLAAAVGPCWYRRRQDNLSADTSICHQLLRDHARFATTGLYTVNYRAGMTKFSATAEYFLAGNAAMQRRYGDRYPWRA